MLDSSRVLKWRFKNSRQPVCPPGGVACITALADMSQGSCCISTAVIRNRRRFRKPEIVIKPRSVCRAVYDVVDVSVVDAAASRVPPRFLLLQHTARVMTLRLTLRLTLRYSRGCRGVTSRRDDVTSKNVFQVTITPVAGTAATVAMVMMTFLKHFPLCPLTSAAPLPAILDNFRGLVDFPTFNNIPFPPLVAFAYQE